MVKTLTFKEDIMKNNKYVYEDENGNVHRNYEAIATLGISNMLSLDIISINYGIDDTITTIFSDGTGCTTAKIRYSKNLNPYFLKYGFRYDLDEFIRL